MTEIKHYRSISLDLATSRDRFTSPLLSRSRSLGSIPIKTNRPMLTYQQNKQINFLNNLKEALERIYPDDNFQFLNTFKQQIVQKDNFNSKKFKEDLDKKLSPYRMRHGFCNTLEYKLWNTDDKRIDCILDTISTAIIAEYFLHENIFCGIHNKKNRCLKNSLLKSGIANEWCSYIFKKYNELIPRLKECNKQQLISYIHTDQEKLKDIGLYTPKDPDNKNENISGKEFFNHLIPFDLLNDLKLNAMLLYNNVDYNKDTPNKKEQIANNKIKEEARETGTAFMKVQQKRANSIYIFTADKKMEKFTDLQDKKDYIFSTGKYGATEEYGATGLLEVIQDYENHTSYVKDSLEIKIQIDKKNNATQEALANEQARRAAEELLALFPSEENKNTQKKATGGGKKKKENFKKNKKPEPKKSTPKQEANILKSSSNSDEICEHINNITSLEGFIEVENSKKRVPLGEYNIPKLNEFIDAEKYISWVNPDTNNRNISVIKLNKNDDTPKSVKLYLSKSSQEGNAFINHIKQRHGVFYQWACKYFDDVNDNNLAKKLLQTALNTLKEGKGDVSITNPYIDDSGMTHDVQAFQIQVPLKDAHDNTKHEVILRLQKDCYKRLVLVTAFEQGKTD